MTEGNIIKIVNLLYKIGFIENHHRKYPFGIRSFLYKSYCFEYNIVTLYSWIYNNDNDVPLLPTISSDSYRVIHRAILNEFKSELRELSINKIIRI